MFLPVLQEFKFQELGPNAFTLKQNFVPLLGFVVSEEVGNVFCIPAPCLCLYQ